MKAEERILIIQTAFLGDVVLTLPLAQVARELLSVKVDFVATPRAAELLRGHPSINEVIVFDKYGRESGLSGLLRLAKQLRAREYSLAFIPHRSVRSALLGLFAGIPKRIGFHRSTGRWFLTTIVKYDEKAHEVERNLSLLGAVRQDHPVRVLPRLYPSREDVNQVDNILSSLNLKGSNRLIAVAPGTIWNTKRWLKDRFAGLAGRLAKEAYDVLLIGGVEDGDLCDEIKFHAASDKVHVMAGKLTVTQSAELIRRCRLLVSNDSAPMHLAVAVATPVIAIFGATVPEFGFAPIGVHDVVLGTKGLACRPCSIHGTNECPIKTFECMKAIAVDDVVQRVQDIMATIPS
jgi:heptosyltransferase-2